MNQALSTNRSSLWFRELCLTMSDFSACLPKCILGHMVCTVHENERDRSIASPNPISWGTWQPGVVLCKNLKDTTLRFRRPGPLRPCTHAAQLCRAQDQSRRSLPGLTTVADVEVLLRIRCRNRGLSISPSRQSVQGIVVTGASEGVELAAFEKQLCGTIAVSTMQVQIDGQVWGFWRALLMKMAAA